MTTINLSPDTLIPYPGNAKKHDKKQIANVAESMRRYGIVQPLVIDKDNVIVIGHCRALAAQQLGLKSVPCVRVDELTPEEVNALRLVDNKTNESPWDFDLLATEMEGLDLSGFDLEWDLPEIEEIAPIEDDVPEVALGEEPKSKPGDIWGLGRHRLMCGDSTSAEQEQMLVGGGTDGFATHRPSL